LKTARGREPPRGFESHALRFIPVFAAAPLPVLDGRSGTLMRKRSAVQVPAT
jgi:hypothetical protein